MKSQSGSREIDIGDLARTYAVVREIGRGGMGAVVLARHREARHYVAIKIASTDKLDAESLARFSREAYLMARFRHPNIVSLYTVESIGQGRVGIVMEYVRGQSLARLLSSGKPLPLESCTRIVRDLGKALAHAHAHGVVHRDVKPQNVLVEDETGAAKLADFGIAKVTSDTADVTATGAALGTPAYMSPEQIDGAPLDGRSDIYSLGVLAWEMVAGQRPWAGEPLFKLLYKQKHEPLPPVTLFRPDAPVGLQLALEGALAKDPAARWLGVNDLLAQLDEDQPTPALLARREREASAHRARGAGASNDAATLPVQRNAPRAPSAAAAPSHRAAPVGETTMAFGASVDAAAGAAGDRRVEPGARAPLVSPARVSRPVFDASSWRRYLPFVGGLLFGGTAVLVALALRSGAPAATTVAAPSGASPGRDLVDDSADVRTASVPVASRRSADGGAPPAATGRPAPGGEHRASGAVERETAVAMPRRSAATQVEAATPAPVGPVAPPVIAEAVPSATVAASRAREAGSTSLDKRAAAYALANQARVLVFAGERSRVPALVDSALALDPRSGASYALRARLRIAAGEVRDAWTDIEMAARTGARWESLALSTMLWAREQGARMAGRRLSGDVRDALVPRRVLEAERAVGLAAALAQSGDTATALTLLERANPSDPGLRALLLDPLLQPLQRSARFRDLRTRASR